METPKEEQLYSTINPKLNKLLGILVEEWHTSNICKEAHALTMEIANDLDEWINEIV